MQTREIQSKADSMVFWFFFGSVAHVFGCKRCKMHVTPLNNLIPVGKIAIVSNDALEPTPHSHAERRMHISNIGSSEQMKTKPLFGNGNNKKIENNLFKNMCFHFDSNGTDVYNRIIKWDEKISLP